MAIKFEKKDGEGKPVKKEPAAKAHVSEEPAPEADDPPGELPFGKPVKTDKKGRRK